MKVRFLGSGDAFGSGGRFQTCILLESSATRLLVDCGASSLIAMRRPVSEFNRRRSIARCTAHSANGKSPSFIRNKTSITSCSR